MTASPQTAPSEVTELRVQIHGHLERYPWLTAYEVARALGRCSVWGVKTTLARMEDDGEAESRTRPRAPGDTRPAIEWRAA